ncbi:HET-domain-containing protein [Decorospora gaudefroyi]|uniref:HET-domain-containing protein n=1 Tax=Decorospora gaudefroyi TaxID=184978 RepID=A0A6A5KLJ3_9PLEO|nr:HET-domain-containing protein [Decorospora gaudefroyi]
MGLDSNGSKNEIVDEEPIGSNGNPVGVENGAEEAQKEPTRLKQESKEIPKTGRSDNAVSNSDVYHHVAGQRDAGGSSLCPKCHDLKLTTDRFIVRTRAPRDGAKPAFFQLTSTTRPIPLGTLREIVKSSQHCSLCKLVLRSVQDGIAEPTKTLQEYEGACCTLSWEVDGREMIETRSDPDDPQAKQQSPRGLTRRIHLRWNTDSLKDSYLVYVASGKRITASDAERAWNSNLLFLGREIGLRGNIQARVKSWIDLCHDKHQGPCSAAQDNDIWKRFLDMVSHSYFGVIDVLNMQLTELPTLKNFTTDLGETPVAPQYVALSYVWGTAPAYRTVLANVMQHRMHGGLDRVFHRLPKVIQDAIDLVRRLGIQYLWIDALCIIQDSARSWKLNAYNMDLIYGNAAFTICAADGPSATTGLRAMHEGTGIGSEDQLIADCADNVRLVVSRPPEMHIKSSRWNTRAWTFQERLLSRRCLIFTGSRVYFQCRSTGMSEDIFADREGAGWSLDFMDAPLQTFRQLPLRSIWVYMKTVELYTARELTKQADILAAFSGVSNLMQQTMQAPFVFGLPTSHFDLALLWEHFQPAERRRLNSKAAEGEFSDFPSWSWSGWYDASAHYRRDTIEECLDDVNEWLEERTWIRWYIRDGNGDLRPLWDQDEWLMDRSKHEKWQGYGNDRSSGSMTFWAKSRSRRSIIITRGTTRHFRGNGDVYPYPSYCPGRHLTSPPQKYTPPPSPDFTEARPRHRERDVSPDRTLDLNRLQSTTADPDTYTVTTKQIKTITTKQTDPEVAHQIKVDKTGERRLDIYINGPRNVSPPACIIYECETADESLPQEGKEPSTTTQPPLRTEVSLYSSLSPFAQLVGHNWQKSRSAVWRWTQIAYRNEIIRFLIDVLVALLRLCSVLLGMPMSHAIDHTNNEPSPSRKRGRSPSLRPAKNHSTFYFFKDAPPPAQRSSAPSPTPSPPPAPGQQHYNVPLPPISRPSLLRRRSSYSDDEYNPIDRERGIRSRYGEERRPSPDKEIHFVGRPQNRVYREPSPEGFAGIEIERNPGRSALYSEIDRTPRSSRTIKQVRYDDTVKFDGPGHHDHYTRPDNRPYGSLFSRPYDRHYGSLFSRPDDHRYSSHLSRADDRHFHDLVFQPDRKMDPEQTELQPEFRITLKEYPYQPVIAPYDVDLGTTKVSLMPILQFWTWHTFLHIQCPSASPDGLIRCNIADKFGDWCGSIMLDARWVGNAKTAKQEFIAISEAKKFTEEECETWSYYVPKEREESEWDLFYVLLIAWNDGRWERMGLGKAFKEAFRDAAWKEIVLA